MKLELVRIANLERENVPLDGVLHIEITTDDGARYSIALGDDPYLDIHLISRDGRNQIVVQPRASNAVYLHAER